MVEVGKTAKRNLEEERGKGKKKKSNLCWTTTERKGRVRVQNYRFRELEKDTK